MSRLSIIERNICADVLCVETYKCCVRVIKLYTQAVITQINCNFVGAVSYMSEKTILVWFRNDLRVRDNEILLEAVRKADKILPVYCFDPFYFVKNPSGNS